MEFNYFSHNGKIMPVAEARVELSDIQYQYGFGVYETIRIANGSALFLHDHSERLLESARIIGLEHQFDAVFFEKSIQELIEANTVGTCNLKVLLIGGKSKESASLHLLCLNPFFPDKDLYRNGVSCTTYRYERSYPHAKSLGMLDSYIAFREAKKRDAYDALFVNAKGDITEGTRTNILGISGETIISPPEEEILLGVTRKYVLEVAKKIGLRVQEAPMPLAEIDKFESLVLTSTSSKILPIKEIDGTTFDVSSPKLRELLKSFDEFLDEVRE